MDVALHAFAATSPGAAPRVARGSRARLRAASGPVRRRQRTGDRAPADGADQAVHGWRMPRAPSRRSHRCAASALHASRECKLRSTRWRAQVFACWASRGLRTLACQHEQPARIPRELPSSSSGWSFRRSRASERAGGRRRVPVRRHSRGHDHRRLSGHRCAIAGQAGLDVAAVLTGDELDAMSDERARGARAVALRCSRASCLSRSCGSSRPEGERRGRGHDGRRRQRRARDQGRRISASPWAAAVPTSRGKPAAIVLLDDDFGSIVQDHPLGRRIYDNLERPSSSSSPCTFRSPGSRCFRSCLACRSSSRRSRSRFSRW